MTEKPMEPGVEGVEDLDSADMEDRLERDPESQVNREAPGEIDPDGNQQPVYRRQEPPA
ncbi:MAG: hypothetical protein H0V23_04830 [Nocardioidaceae bacterium]|nr:hypothetical protein [Nocardioidaceae bacterium]